MRTAIVEPNGNARIHPFEEDRIHRARLIERGIITPNPSPIYDPYYVRDLPALMLDDAGRAAASRHQAEPGDYMGGHAGEYH